MKLTEFKHYIGDVNLEYGGLFYSLEDFKYGYAECLRITDLDSGCGFDGAVLVERITAYFDDSKHVKNALRSCGGMFKGLDSKARKCLIIDAVVCYGYYDPVQDFSGPHQWIIQCELNGPKEYDGWKADIVLSEDDDLFSYLLREGYLSEFE